MTCNATKRRRHESDVSGTSGLSTQTQLTDLSGSSQDDNNDFNVRRNSDKSDTNSTVKIDSAVPEIPSNFKFNTHNREKIAASRKGSAQRVSFSIDDGDLENVDMNEPCGQFKNSGRICDFPHTRPNPRPRNYSENSENTVNYTGCNQPLHHSVSMPYTQHAIYCSCASCFDRKQYVARELLHSMGPDLTNRKSPSMRSLPDIQNNGIPLQYPAFNHMQMPNTIVTMNDKRDGTYRHTVCTNPVQHNPRSLRLGTLETIQGGNTPSSTLDYRPLPQMPGVDQPVKSCSEASYEMVKTKSSQPLIDSPVSSKHSSESSRSEKFCICNKVTVLVILNVVLILVIVSAVPVYVFVLVGGQTVSEPGPTGMLVQQQTHQMNKPCVSCSVLDKFDNHEQLGMEKRAGDLCCLKADTNLVDFIIKMRGDSPTYIRAEDEEIYYGRPILQLKSMGLGQRKVHWDPRGIARGGMELKDSHKIEFSRTGYYFVSTELAFKPNSKGILQAEFTAFVNPNKGNSSDKPLRSQSETLTNQPKDSRYVSECNFVDVFSNGSHLYVKLDHVEGLQEEDGQIMIFFLGN